MGVSSLPKTVTRQSRDCDLNPGPTAPESVYDSRHLQADCQEPGSTPEHELGVITFPIDYH